MAMPAWIAEVGVAGTWVVAIAAIWGEKIRSGLFKPQLGLELVSRAGELTTQSEPVAPLFFQGGGIAYATSAVTVSGAPTWKKARFYHLRVVNARRWPVAHEVQVIITRVEAEGPNGQPQTIYTGPLPLGWRHPELHPSARTVGPEAEADFFYVTDEDQLLFTPMTTPNNFPARRTGRTRMWATVMARAIEADSKPLRIEIAWDGKWEPGEVEMQSHLSITVA